MPFRGFPKEGLSFLRQRKRNNNRDWRVRRIKREPEDRTDRFSPAAIEKLEPVIARAVHLEPFGRHPLAVLHEHGVAVGTAISRPVAQ